MRCGAVRRCCGLRVSTRSLPYSGRVRHARAAGLTRSGLRGATEPQQVPDGVQHECRCRLRGGVRHLGRRAGVGVGGGDDAVAEHLLDHFQLQPNRQGGLAAPGRRTHTKRLWRRRGQGCTNPRLGSYLSSATPTARRRFSSRPRISDAHAGPRTRRSRNRSAARKGTLSSPRRRRRSVRTRGGALEQQRALASVSREGCRAFEFLACLVEAAEFGQEIAAHARQ
jgi:hypothetical protein